MRRAVAVVLAGLGLAGCHHGLGPPEVAYGTGDWLPIVHPDNDDDRWYVVADMGGDGIGERLWFFDTGYSYTTCDDDLVKELGLETKGRVVVHGEAGDVDATTARLPPFTLAGHQVDDLVCLVRDLGTTSSLDDPEEVRIAGVLGADLLRRFDVHVDPGRPGLGLMPPDSLALTRRDDGAVRMRREYGFGLRFTVPVEVAERTIRPVVDTGASGTHVDGRRLRLRPTLIQERVAVRASGETGHVVRDLVYFRVEDLAVAGYPIGPVMLTDRQRAGWVPGLLGLNVLGGFYQEYDFDARVARFTPVVAVDVPSYAEWSTTRP